MLTFILVTFLIPPLILVADYIQKNRIHIKGVDSKVGT